MKYCFSINPLKNALRFEVENRNWDHRELKTHSDAFAYGLTELGWKS